VLVPFRGERIDSLTLLIEDGDDAPLAVRGARARRQASDLYLAAPAGQYFLLVGYPDAAAPRYELAAVRDVVLAVRSAPVVSGVFAKNPTYSTRARLLAGSTPARLAQRLGVWAVLLLAVAVLAGLTLRVVRREPRPGGGSPP